MVIMVNLYEIDPGKIVGLPWNFHRVVDVVQRCGVNARVDEDNDVGTSQYKMAHFPLNIPQRELNLVFHIVGKQVEDGDAALTFRVRFRIQQGPNMRLPGHRIMRHEDPNARNTPVTFPHPHPRSPQERKLSGPFLFGQLRVMCCVLRIRVCLGAALPC